MRRSKSLGRGLNRDEEEEKALPTYSTLRTGVLRLTPGDMKCRLYCGGRKCKYCKVDGMAKELQAIPGLYSTWITGEILAMARPTKEHFERGLIEEFKKLHIHTVINLQEAGEHSFCGPPLLSSGFTYDPEELMRNDIFHYNFPMPDYQTCDGAFLIDIMKVMQFAVEQGKVAVHCHAGHGRTGMLISSYLIYWEGVKAVAAVAQVRDRRPNSVQSLDQVRVLSEIYDTLKRRASILPCCISKLSDVLATNNNNSKASINGPAPLKTQSNGRIRAIFTRGGRKAPEPEKKEEKPPPVENNDENTDTRPSMTEYMAYEKPFLAGPEKLDFKKYPKLVYVLCKLLLERFFLSAELVVRGRDINDRRLDWAIGPPKPNRPTRDTLSELLEDHGKLEECLGHYNAIKKDVLVTVANCKHQLGDAGASVLLALMDSYLMALRSPPPQNLRECIVMNTNLAEKMGAHADEPWEWCFLLISRVFSLICPDATEDMAKLIQRWFANPAEDNPDEVISLVESLLLKVMETRSYWSTKGSEEEATYIVDSEGLPSRKKTYEVPGTPDRPPTVDDSPLSDRE